MYSPPHPQILERADAAQKHGSKFSTARSSDIFAGSPVSSLRCAAMQEIADWLERLGMSEYAQRFAENRIDFEILPDLTDQDLEKLGVVLGDRRKMLRAITNLGKTVDAPPSAPSRPAPPIVAPTVTPPAEAAGERRHVTVMFCDLVDSTGISAKLDAEEWRDLVGAYLDAASTAVLEMGGKVAKKLGDG